MKHTLSTRLLALGVLLGVLGGGYSSGGGW
jgi:hypothetical protein